MREVMGSKKRVEGSVDEEKEKASGNLFKGCFK